VKTGIFVLSVFVRFWTWVAVLGTAQMREAWHVSRKYFASSGWTRGAIPRKAGLVRSSNSCPIEFKRETFSPTRKKIKK
jgi:hypothetical protein